MPDPTTQERLKGLILSAADLKSLSGWPDVLVEDYLNNLDNLIIISDLLDIEIDKKIEEIETAFANGSVPFVEDGLLVEDNTNIIFDTITKVLTLGGALLNNLTASRLTASNASKQIVSVAALSAWIAGTANQITITDDGDGTITISIPDSPTFITPTIADLSNMTHDHKSAAKGGDYAWADMTQAATQADVAASVAHNIADAGETCDRSDIEDKLNALGTEINKMNDLIDKLQAANLMT